MHTIKSSSVNNTTLWTQQIGFLQLELPQVTMNILRCIKRTDMLENLSLRDLPKEVHVVLTGLRANKRLSFEFSFPYICYLLLCYYLSFMCSLVLVVICVVKTNNK